MSDRINYIERLLESDDETKVIFDKLVKLLQSLFSTRYSWVGIYLVEGQELVLKAWCGPQATEHEKILIGTGICGLAAQEKQTIIVLDVQKDDRYLECFPNTKSEIVVPIITEEGQVLGEIDIDSDKPNAFTDEDKDFLEAVAQDIAKKAAILGLIP